MMLSRVYSLGRSLPILHSEKIDEKLRFVLFPYDSSEVLGTTLLALVAGCVLSILLFFLYPFLGYVLFFFTVIVTVVLYIYPTHVYYSQAIGTYNEEMLRAILRMTTFVSMESSIEYAVVETTDSLHGTLRLQFQKITNDLKRKQKVTLGDAIKPYLDTWNKINPVFVKSFRLLQTAALSEKKDRDDILNETIETMLMNYSTLGKRYAEELANNAKKLITVGVLIPILSLMLIPILSIFMPDFARPSILAFVYIVFFPTVTLLMALNFSSKRVQVDTIRIEEADEYRDMPTWIPMLCIGVAVLFAIPTLAFLPQVEAGQPNAESALAIFLGWLISFGIMLGVWLYAKLYVQRYGDLWNRVNDIEQDLPHLLQSFTTYLTLNLATENVIEEVIKDYKNFGFSKHPVVMAFEKLRHTLLTSKETLMEITEKQLPKLLPSRKVNQVLTQIMSFSEISQKSSAKIAKMVRSQTMSIYKLDDYIKTMLSETMGLINVTTTLLAPLLAAAAVIMSVAIVKSLVYITDQLQAIASAFGTTDIGFSLVDTSNIVPPVFIETIIGIYLVLTILVMSFFSTQINVGNDKYRFFENIKTNVTGFIVYSFLLLGGYFFTVEVLFKRVLLG